MRCVLPGIPDVVHFDTGQPLHLSYMLRNEPFEELPLVYKPVEKLDHYPPRLSFGIAIPEEFDQFLQVVLENNLGDSEELRTTKCFFKLRTLVMPFLNGRCGLGPDPDEAIVCGFVHSLETALVLELQSNYMGRVPEDKIDDVIRVIKEIFRLPDDAKPKWYLEYDTVPARPTRQRKLPRLMTGAHEAPGSLGDDR